MLAAVSDTDRQQVATEQPNVHAAFQIHKADKLTRGALEARILARLPLEKVAAACQVTVEAVQAYEHLFFNVRDGLDLPDFVVMMAFGEKLHYGLDAIDVDIVLKHVAYFAGPCWLTN